jgi:hypothetical protein
VRLGFHGQVRLDLSWPGAIYIPAMLLHRVAFPDFCEPGLPSPRWLNAMLRDSAAWQPRSAFDQLVGERKQLRLRDSIVRATLGWDAERSALRVSMRTTSAWPL